MGLLSTQFYNKINLNTDFDTAFDAILKIGNTMGKVLTTDKGNGTVVFKQNMSLLKMQDPAKFHIKIEQSDNGMLAIEIIGDAKSKRTIEKGFNNFKELLSSVLNYDIKDLINKEFIPDKIINGYLEIDSLQHKWSIPNNFNGKAKIYNYEDILSFELLEDGETITSGGLGRAVAGGLAFGAAGAIVGGITGCKKSKSLCTSLSIKISINDIQNPTAYINFIFTAAKKNGLIYKVKYSQAQECVSILEFICKEASKSNDSMTSAIQHGSLSQADEILKFKNLLDAGIITQEEFEIKKKQLL